MKWLRNVEMPYSEEHSGLLWGGRSARVKARLGISLVMDAVFGFEYLVEHRIVGWEQNMTDSFSSARTQTRVLILALATLVAMMTGCASGSGDGGNSGESAQIGSPASDGQFTFTVHSFECGEKTLGKNRFLKAKAKGEFCIAEVTVENTGDKSQLMDGSSQYLYIGDKEYSADSDAIFADKRAEAFFVEEINPGLSVEGIIVWDVPVGSNPDRLELHDSAFSGGVEVSL